MEGVGQYLKKRSHVMQFRYSAFAVERKERLMKNTSDLTQEQIEELKNLDSFPVDYSDIPKRTDFSKAKFKYYELKPKKEVVTIRLDADLLAVLRSYGKGYQTKVNDALRSVFM